MPDSPQIHNRKVLAGTPTPQRILDTAEELFAEKGYEATSVRDITSRAGCNLASVNYHFGGKQNLYATIFQRMLSVLRDYRIAGLEQVIREPGVNLETILRTFSRVFLEPLVEGRRGPRMMQLFLREMVEPRLPPGTIVTELFEPISHAFGKALKQQCPDLSEPSMRLCMISIVGQLAHMLMTFQLYKEAGRTEFPIHQLEQVIEHVVRFAEAGIRRCAADDTKNHAKEEV